MNGAWCMVHKCKVFRKTISCCKLVEEQKKPKKQHIARKINVLVNHLSIDFKTQRPIPHPSSIRQNLYSFLPLILLKNVLYHHWLCKTSKVLSCFRQNL